MGKKALKGFGNVKYFPLTANTSAAYTPTNPGSALGVGARSCTASDTRNEYKIPGDDGIYDQGSEYESTELQISVNEMPLEVLAALTGADYDDLTDVMSEGELDNAPEVALSFSGLRSDGGYRLYQYLCCKLTSYKADLKARLDNGNDVSQYQLTFLCLGRTADKKVRLTRDVDKPVGGAADLTWLNTVAAIPTVP